MGLITRQVMLSFQRTGFQTRWYILLLQAPIVKIHAVFFLSFTPIKGPSLNSDLSCKDKNTAHAARKLDRVISMDMKRLYI
jgi:hypothetical protein